MANFKYFRIFRAHQWVKNFFIFFPLFFSGNFFVADKLLETFQAAILFSLLTSSIYIINDILDIKSDQLHEVKKKRPIANGDVSIKNALIISLILFSVAVLCVYAFFSLSLFITFIIYWLVNLLYSFKLKTIPIVDVLIIALGFIIRIVIGGLISEVILSHWLIIMTFLLSLFLALAKRRDDLVIKESTGNSMRKSLEGYSIEFINLSMVMLSSIIIVSYIMYSISEEVTSRVETPFFYVTGFFVVLGVLRYMQITFVENRSGSPTKILLTDPITIISIVLWAATIFYFIYG